MMERNLFDAPGRRDGTVGATTTAPEGADRRFSLGDPVTIAEAARVIEQVVRYRGYYVPADHRPDVVQEALLDVVQSIRDQDFEDDAAFYRFIRTIAHRRCIDWVRRASRRKPLDPRVEEVLDPGNALLQRERTRLASSVVGKLKRPCRDLIVLRLGRGMTFCELSRVLGRSEGALRTQSHRCLRQARRLMQRIRTAGKLVKIDDWRTR